MGLIKYNNLSISSIDDVSGIDDSMVLIKTETASNDATISFVDGTSSVVLDNTYPVYLIKMINVHGITDDTQFKFQGNSAGGSGFNETITSTYFKAGHKEDGTYTTIAYSTGSDQAQATGFQTIGQPSGNANDESTSGTLHVFDPSSTTFVKHFYSTFNSSMSISIINNNKSFTLNVDTILSSSIKTSP